MANGTGKLKLTKSTVEIGRIELSTLVGHEVLVFSDQVLGKPIRSRVIMVCERNLSLDRGTGGMVENLAHNQDVTVQFDYKGQRLSVSAVLKRTDGGKCTLVMGENIVPLQRRRFQRYAMQRQVKCAVVPVKTFTADKLAHLRWLQTDSVNFSSGGILLNLPSQLIDGTYLLLNIDVQEVCFPALVLGLVRYSFPTDGNHFRTGVEFVVNELKEKHLPRPVLSELPASVFEYNMAERNQIDRLLSARTQEESKTGVEE